MIFVSGCYPHISALDSYTLDPEFNIRTPSRAYNCRVVPVHTPTETRPNDDFILAVSQMVFNPHEFSVVTLVDVNLSGKETQLAGLQGPVYGLCCVSPTRIFRKPRIVAGSFGNSKMFVWDNDGNQLCDMASLAYHADIKHFPEWESDSVYVAGGHSSRIARFSLELGTRSSSQDGFVGHSDLVNGLAADISRGLLFSCSFDSKLKFWDRSAGICRKTLELAGRGASLGYAEDLNLLLVGLTNGSFEMWDPRIGRRFRTKKLGRFGSLFAFARVGEQDDFVVVSRRKGVNVTLFESSGRILKQAKMPGAVSGVCFVRGSGRNYSSVSEFDFAVRLGFVLGLGYDDMILHLQVGTSTWKVFVSLILL